MTFQPTRQVGGETSFSGAGGVGGGVGGGASSGSPRGTSSPGKRAGVRGWFHRDAQQEEEQLVTMGIVQQFFPIVIPANTAGIYGPINVSANGLQLLKALGVGNSKPDTITGSQTAKVFVRINHVNAPWMPFSFIANSGDAQYLAASIGKIWFYVSTSDAANPVIFVALNNAGISNADSDSASSYSVPGGAQGPQQ